MKCPVCQNVALGSLELQAGVLAQKCTACGGHWLNSLQFANWITAVQTGNVEGAAELKFPLPVHEPKAAKLCPDCGRFMTRYKVGHTLPFALDRCGHCGGTWFDGNEWQTLRGSEFWDRIHLIFSPAWQTRVRQAEQRAQRESQLVAALGARDYAEAKRIKGWLDSHPHRDVIFAYLSAEIDRDEHPTV